MSGEPADSFWSDRTRTADGSVWRLSPGSRLAGRYTLLELVGIGGMGMVYRAEDEQLGLPVAIKILRPELGSDAQWLARFKQELVLARQVSHPNVVRTHDLGNDGDLVFLSMDFIAGRALSELLAESGPLPARQAADIARQLAGALEAAHDAGVIHRDLKPSNVLIDAAGRAAISDFGVARSLIGSGLTATGSIVGTLDYLSPEQARGDEVDRRSDLYALGILLFEMLTGELPFAHGSQAEVLAQRLTGIPRDVRSSGVKVPAPLAAVVRRLLQKNPSKRYQSASEVVADLDRLEVAPRRFARKPAAFALGALALAALLALGWAAQKKGWLGGRGAATTSAISPKGMPTATAPQHTVALLPLADQTGRADLAWVASGLPELLAPSLAEGSALLVLNGERVARTLESLKLAPGPLPALDAQRLAELLDADRLVVGSVRSAGGRLRIDLTLVSADLPGAPARPLQAEAASAEISRLVESLGARLREQLAVPAAAATPISRTPAALAAYSEGVARLRRGDSRAAAQVLERAVALDAGWSAAWVQLAHAREAEGKSDAARSAAKSAVESLGPGESRGAFEAQALLSRLAGHPEKAQEILSRLVARYPGDVEARIDLAEAYGDQGSLDRAVATLSTAVESAPHHPRAWYLLAKYSILGGNARRAVDDYLVHALVIQNQLDSDEGRADVLNALGVAYRDLGEVERARETYEQAATIRRRIGDDRGYATTLRNLATLDLVRGEYASAKRRLDEALAILMRLGDETSLADLYNEFGVLAEERGDFQAALDSYQKALRARRDLGDDRLRASSYGNVGYTYYLLGRYDDAMVYFRQGLDLAEKSGDPRGVALAIQNRGLLELARGDWNQAVESFLVALRSGRELGIKEVVAASHGSLGRLAHYQGRPGPALASFAEALGVLREIEDRRGVAEFTLAEAEVELDLGREAAAGELMNKAEKPLRESPNREQSAELERLRGERYLLRGEAAAAGRELARARNDAEASHGLVELLEVRVSAARAERASGGARAALAELLRLDAQTEALGHVRLRLRVAEELARTALASGDPRRAREAARAGLDIAAGCGGYFGAYRLHFLLALALEREGHSVEAAAERDRAAAEIARVGRDLSPERRVAFERLAHGRP